MFKSKKSNNTNIYKLIEIVLLFIVTPIVLITPTHVSIKIGYLLLGVIYISFVSSKKEAFKKRKIESKISNNALKRIGLRFIVIAVSTTLFVYFQDRTLLFSVMLNKTSLWLKFNLIYVLVSVIPQELIYRTFFVKRYQKLFKNEFLFIIINAALFSFGHIWFQSWIVLGFTFVGGVLFIKTYLKTKSLGLVLFEHSLYGVWLYTVGYGKLFLFPV